MAVNKDAIGILFGVAGGAYPSGESYKRINTELNEIINGINSNDPKFIKLHVDDLELDKEIDKIKQKVQNVAIGTNIKIASGEAAEGLNELSKASDEAAKKASKHTAAYDQVANKIERLKNLLLEASKASEYYYKKKIRLDENLNAHTENERLLKYTDEMNSLWRDISSLTDDSVLGKMYKREASAVQTQLLDLKNAYAESKGFVKTTAAKEAQRAAETEAINKKQRESIEATKTLTDALRAYHDGLLEVIKAENVWYKNKKHSPVNDTEEARKAAEHMNALADAVTKAKSNPALTKIGQQSAYASYKAEIQELLNQITPDYNKSNTPIDATYTMMNKDEAAFKAYIDLMKSLDRVKYNKSDSDLLSVINGSVRLLDPLTEKAITQTQDLTVHQRELLQVINDLNEKFVVFQQAIAAFGDIDPKELVKSDSYQRLLEKLQEITSATEELSVVSKEAAEMRELLYGKRSVDIDDQTIKGRLSSKSLVGYYSAYLNSAKRKKNDPEGFNKALEDVRRQAADIAKKSGDEWGDEFFRSVQKKTHVKIPYWKKELETATAATQTKTDEQRIKAAEQQIEAVKTKVAEATDLASKKSVDVSNAVNKVKTDLQQTEQKLQEVAKTEESTANKTVESEQKKVKAKQETKRQTEATTESNKQEQTVVQETAKVVKDSEDEKAKKAFETWKLKNQWLEAEALHEKEKANQAKAAAAEEAAQKRAAAEEVREAERAVREEEREKHKQEIKDRQEAIKIADEYYKVRLKIEKLMLRDNKITSTGNGEDKVYNFNGTHPQAQEEYKKALERYQNLSAAQRQYLSDLHYKEQAEVRLNADIETSAATAMSRWNKLRDKAMQYYRDMQGVATRSKEAQAQLENIYQLANENDYRNYDQLNTVFEDAKGFIDRNGLAVADWFQKAAKTFGSRIRSLLAGLTLGGFSQYLRQIYSNVVEIDSALTQLRIVTGATDKQMEAFLTNSTKLAKELGSSIKDVLGSIETFSRLGYNLSDATMLSQYATILSKVAAVSTDEATKGLTSIIKGYGFTPGDSEHIADVLVEVGQKYAVSASELMTAYERAGAALNATNTSFEKSAGLIAAANATLQDASIVGTALKTVSARIRKSKTDLDELGESADDLSQSWSVYAEEIKALTGFDIMVEGSTTKFKDLYDIFAGIAAVWDDIGAKSDTAQARVAEILGGTRQFSVISSILSNWKDAVGAYNDALQSSGASMEAMEIYVDSIQGRLGQLKATFEELSAHFLDSELAKNAISIATGILSFADGLVKIVNLAGGLKTILTITAALVAYTKAEPIMKFFAGLVPALKNFITEGIKSAELMTIIAVKGKEAALAEAAIADAETKMAVNAAIAHTSMLKLLGVIAAIAVLIKVLESVDKSWQKSYTQHAENAKALQEQADQYQEEINTLEDLQKRLQDAAGNKQKLAAIYDDLNKKVSVSTSLIDGEAGAYESANQQLRDQINLKKQLLQISRTQAISEQRSAFNSRKLVSYGGSLQLDWASMDVNGNEVRQYMRGRGYDEVYDSNITPDQQANWLYFKFGATPESWKEYWDNQVKTALSIFSDVIGSADGYLNGDFITNVIKTLVMHGYDLDEIDGAVASLESADSEVESLIEQYYSSLANKDAASSEYYDKIVGRLNEIKAQYPELIEAVDLVIGSISKSIDTQNTDVLKLKTVSQMLEEMSSSYDAITSAMADMDEYGTLTAKTFETMTKNNLVQYLTETENGYILNADALDRYTEAMIENVTVGATLEEMTAEQKEIVLNNLENLRRTLAMLAVSSNSTKSASDTRKEALNDEKEALNDQLDAYKKLIDLRKDLLKQYEDEINYKKELEKKEKEVARLQTLFTVSQLDTSAAGRAKTRQLAQELKEAQEDLDDFTLEHAIDVVTNELDGQYEEYKKFMDGKIDAIEQAIDALGTSNSTSTSRASAAIQSALRLVEAKIAAVQAAPVVNPVINVEVVVPETKDNGVQPTSWASYEDAKSAGFGNIATEKEFKRNTELVKKYGSYQHYLAAMYEKYMGTVAGTHIRAGKVTYHSGGVVGDTAKLKSTETFAKLLKGEFVATPAMMETFINKTLPNIVNSGGSNEFNAPLIEINCENVTQEALPKFKEIVDNAVKEIKSQLDNGMSRAGYRKPTRKITV